MISEALIVKAGILAGLAVLIAAVIRRWRFGWIVLAACGATAGTIAWRGIANALALNTDFMPGVSVGDVGCLFAGALVPFAVSRARVARASGDVVPAVVGGFVSFIVNVLIL